MIWGFPGGSDGEESTCSVGNLGSVPRLGRFPGEGNRYPLQYSDLENSIDRGAWQATVHGVTKSRTWLSDFHFSWLKKKDTMILKLSHHFAIDSVLNMFIVLQLIVSFEYVRSVAVDGVFWICSSCYDWWCLLNVFSGLDFFPYTTMFTV